MSDVHLQTETARATRGVAGVSPSGVHPGPSARVRAPIGAGASVLASGPWLPPRRAERRPGGAVDAPPPTAAAELTVSPAALGLLSRELCLSMRLLPLSLRGGVLTVGVASLHDGLARKLIQRTADRAGVEARLVRVDEHDLQGALVRMGATHAPSGRARVLRETGFRRPRRPDAPSPTRPSRPWPTIAPIAPPVDTVAPRAPAVEPPAPVTEPLQPLRLGELLIRGGHLTEAQLAAALVDQGRTGSLLGEVLTHSGVVSEELVGQTLAGQAGMGLVSLEQHLVDNDLLRRLPRNLAARHLIVPFVSLEDGRVAVATTDPYDQATLHQVQTQLGAPISVYLATDTAIDNAIRRAYADEDVETATNHLLDSNPEASAFRVISDGQKRFFIIALILGLVLLVIFPIPTLIIANLAASLFYFSFSGYKFWLAYESLGHDNEEHISDAALAALDDRDLPVFTILMPMYREAAVVPKLVECIGRLDYPTSKLDIKLLLEEDDAETLPAIERLNLPPHFRVVVVPDALPKTKPKACNYGLLLARGDITVIYDAEDEPDADQLKKVVLAFKSSHPSTVCVQCKLNYYNRTQNLLTRWFTTEYSMWFDVFLPGLDAHDSPIPLGGTSNHFITSELRELGAWDPHNVAEDADLGIRLNKAGWRTAVLDSTTYEEANPDLGNWIRQRSRWVKGYMQTWLVHMRHPVQLYRAMGLRSFLSFQLTVGGTSFGFLLNPIYWALTTLWLFTEAGVIRELFPSFIYYMAAFGLFAGNFAFTYFNAVGAMRRGHFDLIKFALLSPVYWSFMSIAAWKGAYQLATNPHYWEKTEHGLADHREAGPAGG